MSEIGLNGFICFHSLYGDVEFLSTWTRTVSFDVVRVLRESCFPIEIVYARGRLARVHREVGAIHQDLHHRLVGLLAHKGTTV